MTDIVSLGTDLGVLDTDTSRAANILSVQLGRLTYAPDLGVDLGYFLSPDFKFQNESFKAYLIQVLANHSINVASVMETVESLYTVFTFNVPPTSSDSSLVAG